MKSSRKRGPVVISDSDSDDDLEPLQKKPIRQAPPELVEEVKEMHQMSLPDNQQDKNLPWSLQATQGDIPVPHLLLYSYNTTSYIY